MIPNLGGVEKVTQILSDEFRKKGHSVSFLYICDEKKADSGQLSPAYFINPDDVDKNIKFQDLIKRKKIDVIINQSWSLAMLDFLESLEPVSPPIISVHHNQPFPYFWKERIYKRLDRPATIPAKISKIIALFSPLLFRYLISKKFKREFIGLTDNSDKVMLLSEMFIPRIKKILPELNTKKVSALPNPNTFTIKPDLEDKKEKLIIFVGRLEDPQKNVKAFIDVWNRFYKNHPDWNALIIGDGPHREIFEKYAAKQKSQNLKFIGNQKDMSSYFSRASFLCLTSLYEGWGMVLTEAMAYNCIPLAFASYESIEDIICERSLLVEFNDTESMAKRIEDLLKDSGKMNLIKKNNKEHIQVFDRSRVADLWIKEFGSLISNA